jgi:hypothetical protein
MLACHCTAQLSAHSNISGQEKKLTKIVGRRRRRRRRRRKRRRVFLIR